VIGPTTSCGASTNFRIPGHDLNVRPVYDHKRESIDAQLSIVFAPPPRTRARVRLLGVVELVPAVPAGLLAVQQPAQEMTISQISPNTATAPIQHVG